MVCVGAGVRDTGTDGVCVGIGAGPVGVCTAVVVAAAPPELAEVLATGAFFLCVVGFFLCVVGFFLAVVAVGVVEATDELVELEELPPQPASATPAAKAAISSRLTALTPLLSMILRASGSDTRSE